MMKRQHTHIVVQSLPDSRSNWNLETFIFEGRGKPTTNSTPGRAGRR